MTIVVDENIPYAEEALGQFGRLVRAPGRRITRNTIANADALIVRSITQVHAELLRGTPVQFVGTATIGNDHIDLDYLRENSIAYADANGSNAESVAEYVTAALLELHTAGLCKLDATSIGVIGHGNIGARVGRKARALGMRVVEYDPPLAEQDVTFTTATLDETLACDIVTLHVPLVHGGSNPTYHMANARFFNQLRPNAIFINTARGGVVDSVALQDALRGNKFAGAVLDVWESEPELPIELLEFSRIVTPHIAGHSLDGKLRGTAMMADALARHIGTESLWRPEDVLAPREALLEIDPALGTYQAVQSAVRIAYDILADDVRLRDGITLGKNDGAEWFDSLRKNYPARREFPAYNVVKGSAETQGILRGLGFAIGM